MNEQVLTRPRPLLQPAASLLAHKLRRLRCGSLELTFANGARESIRGAEPGPRANLHIQNPVALIARFAAKNDIGFAEGYFAGDWHTDNLFALLELLARNESALSSASGGLLGPLQRLRHQARRNSRRGSRRNIQAHYDLGNDFYGLWLDETWSYSSARYAHPGEDLAHAQRRKYRQHLDALDARPGEHILEIGCGWGGLALEAAQRGLRVTGITLSPAQLEHATRRVREAGLDHLIELKLLDYRDLDGQYDHVVSIEMFEAVGEAYWPGYFDTVARVLRPGGRASLQVITIDHDYFEHYRSGTDFIQRYVFPGGMLPSKQVFAAATTAAGLNTRFADAFGGDYARTLVEWSRKVALQQDSLNALGYDQRFLRLWQYYLAYCHAGFVTARIDVVQAVLTHA
ncbi:SAM-dependent methyltransferase [Acidihalobacter ferrooxydans]|uniref:SAM-dependent methyltransferase n=1 Tax=Acidihalobacter ferrooxydans TaxID=1765967 RepID=A0A1P8UEX5_9GAMM|nr:cyclopropane-fatty-acyl-phospholipid synthase family protein [Acidihalobacter ferrooxydans]APZ42366.1 SAM-dependent methyltransferase [Acidihalobacter ferrooxydans]